MRWDCHEHRDELRISDRATVYHLEQGQLCELERHYDCILYYPIQFKDKAAAARWIEHGTIAEIQQSIHSLHVGFYTHGFVIRGPEQTKGD